MGIRLTADGLTPVDLDDDTLGYVFVALEVGSPAPRDVVEELAGRDGTDDRTTYVGSRAVTLVIELVERPHTRQALIDRLAPFMHPRRRITIEVATEPGTPPRRLTVRPDDSPLSWRQVAHLPLSWGFRTVGPPWWLGEQRTLDLSPATPPPGRSYDLTYPITFPAAPATGPAVAVNAGSHDADWSWQVTGPCRNPSLRNETTSATVTLHLTLLAGQTATIDGASRTVAIDGTRRWSAVNRTVTTWWPSLTPGTTAVSMPVESASGDAAGVLTWSDTYTA